MDPLIVWMTGALAALGTAFMWLLRWALAHLDSDIAYSRRAAVRGTELAEKGADVAEKAS